DNKPKAERARTEYASALHLFPVPPDGWMPRVMTCSAIEGDGIAEIWDMILDHRRQLEDSGHFAARRSLQALDWIRELVDLGLEESFDRDPAVAARFPEMRDAVRQGRVTPFAASRELLALFHRKGT